MYNQIGIRLRLYDGITPLANLTGIQALWWDTSTIMAIDSAAGRASGISTDAQGWVTLNITNCSQLVVGDTGALMLYRPNALDSRDSELFAGTLQVELLGTDADPFIGVDMAYQQLFEFQRNPLWLAMPTVLATEQKIVGLHAVFPEEASNFVAMTMAGAYTVDWGDGVVENFATGATAYHQFSFATASLAGTDHPVTITAATDTIGRTAHGKVDGDRVTIYNVAGAAGLIDGQEYYIVSATADTFKLSATVGGLPIDITTDGTGALLPYKQTLVTVTPQAGSNLTSFNWQVKHNATGLQNGYATGWLDVLFSGPNVTGLGFVFGGATVRQAMCERFDIEAIGAITSLASAFQNAYCLQTILFPAGSLGQCTTLANAFQNTYSLQSVPFPAGSLGQCTTLSYAFQNTYSLQSISFPAGSLGLCTTLANAFQNAFSLETILFPAGSLGQCTTLSYAFQYAYSLETILFPAGSLGQCTTLASAFQNATSLQSILFPAGSLGQCTTLSYAFQSAYCLQSVSFPAGSLGLCTTLANAFQYAFSLQSVSFPAGSLWLVTTTIDAFTGASTLAAIDNCLIPVSFSLLNCKLSGPELNDIYTALPTVTAQTITVTGNYGTAADNPAIATAKGWTVVG